MAGLDLRLARDRTGRAQGVAVVVARGRGDAVGGVDLLFPSPHHAGGTNLTVFSANLENVDRFAVHHPEDMLPKDQQLWELYKRVPLQLITRLTSSTFNLETIKLKSDNIDYVKPRPISLIRPRRDRG